MIVEPCFIEAGAIIGKECLIGPFVTIAGCVKIGDRCKIGPNTSIGLPPEHKDKPEDYGSVEIGNDVTIRESVTIHAALEPGHVTIIGDRCFIMSHSHLGHDCVLEENVIVSLAKLGGHTIVMKNANVGLNSCTHQFTTIGTGAMIGAGAVVVKDVPPYFKVVGVPASWIGENVYLSKNVTKEFIASETERFKKLRRETKRRMLFIREPLVKDNIEYKPGVDNDPGGL